MDEEKRAGAPEKTQFETISTRVSVVCGAGNLLLAAFKFASGAIGHSDAMISDAVHSTSDILGSVIVVAGVKVSARPSDRSHPYGHERLECVAGLILGGILATIGLLIGWGAVEKIWSGAYRNMPQPGGIALFAAALSIAVKESMFWYTWLWARRIDSTALKAEAWHHRSDALSSVGALIGIAGARMGAPAMEPAASLVICLFIVKAAADIFKDATDKVVDHACDEATERALRECVAAQAGVRRIDLLNTREFGNRVYVDIEIGVDGLCSLAAAHAVAERVHDAVEANFPQVKHVMVHVNPL
ncbi:cation diffusion facilitator family transporter [Pyramidobacter piscolens W5455]|uniref:Cation diffusion facilitator family transporter n=1 Tax=Pyramidobacter piscolens W5455 TaxID=352165 RepID=A0ABM9ZT54_9BACT|nr:cation diffusion facilitator family transporter [Pyramidobacter piscolens]EFB90095.1 cation diffusion facilitator family transporter [Pyramidobacter piscolens W5455]BDF79572.1 cation diffusion facilitator transporter [Pyramidobacter piscolens]